MERVQLVGKDGRAYISADGRHLYPMGDYAPNLGDWVYANGTYIYGHIQPGAASPSIIGSVSGIPVLDNSGELYYFDANLALKKVGSTSYYMKGMVNDETHAYVIYQRGQYAKVYNVLTNELVQVVDYAQSQYILDMEIADTGEVIVVVGKNFSQYHSEKNVIKRYDPSHFTGQYYTRITHDIYLDMDGKEVTNTAVYQERGTVVYWEQYGYDTDYQYDGAVSVYVNGAVISTKTYQSINDSVAALAEAYASRWDIDAAGGWQGVYGAARPKKYRAESTITFHDKARRDKTLSSLKSEQIVYNLFPCFTINTVVDEIITDTKKWSGQAVFRNGSAYGAYLVPGPGKETEKIEYTLAPWVTYYPATCTTTQVRLDDVIIRTQKISKMNSFFMAYEGEAEAKLSILGNCFAYTAKTSDNGLLTYADAYTGEKTYDDARSTRILIVGNPVNWYVPSRRNLFMDDADIKKYVQQANEAGYSDIIDEQQRVDDADLFMQDDYHFVYHQDGSADIYDGDSKIAMLADSINLDDNLCGTTYNGKSLITGFYLGKYWTVTDNAVTEKELTLTNYRVRKFNDIKRLEKQLKKLSVTLEGGDA